MNEVDCYASSWDLQNDNAVIKDMIGLWNSIFPMEMVAAKWGSICIKIEFYNTLKRCFAQVRKIAVIFIFNFIMIPSWC